MIRRQYASISSILGDFPSTTLLVNCTGIGSLDIADIRDTNLYPTRGQTFLIAEPKTPITRMYEFERVEYDGASLLDELWCLSFVALPLTMGYRYLRSQQRIHPVTTYVFPRPLGGGVVCGGSRQDNDWSEEWDEESGQDILKRCCELCPELGKPEDLQVIAKNVGLRRECSSHL